MAYRNIVTVCGDPGGAAALAPVLRLLAKDPYVQLTNFAYLNAGAVLADQGLSFIQLPREKPPGEAIRHLEDQGTHLLLTATSHNPWNWEKDFIAAAKTLQIPSMAVLDFWSSYTLRFSGAEGDLAFLPDKIAVMDEHAKSEMEAEGIPVDRLVVTGQPAFDFLPEAKERFNAAQRTHLRKQYGVADDGLLVVFLSQPFRQFYAEGGTDLGFDERGVLENLMEALDLASEKQSVTLLIRPHPKEHLTSWNDLPPGRTNVVVSNRDDRSAILMAADLVVGMNSIALVDACLLGCPVLSLQPGLIGQDSLPTNRWGASLPVRRQADILPAVIKLLEDPQAREILRTSACEIGNQLPTEASENVIRHIELELSP